MPKRTKAQRHPREQPASPAVPRQIAPLLVGIVLVLLTAWTFWPVVSCQFIDFDDPEYVTANRHLRQGLDFREIAWAFTTGHASNWQPLTWVSLMLDHQLFGDEPAGYHAVNLALHAANVLLVFLIFNRLTGALGRSALVAALFAVHPLRVESVAWVTERKDVLSAFFGLGAMLVYAHWARVGGRWRYGLILLLYMLSLMAKPMLVTLPFLLLLLDFWPLQRFSGGRIAATGALPPDSPATPRSARTLIFEKIPLFILAAASSVATILAQAEGTIKDFNYLPWSTRLGNAAVSYVRYLEKSVRFDELAVYYPYPSAWPVWQVTACAVFLALSVALVLWQARPKPWLMVGWFWYLGLLLPVIGLIQVGTQSMADRFSYLPSIGVALMMIWSLPEWLFSARAGRAALGLATASVLATLCAFTRIQVGYWHDSLALWDHAQAVTQDNCLAHQFLGNQLATHGREGEALDHLQLALKIKPGNALVHVDRGNLYHRMGRYPLALADFERAIELSTANFGAYNNRAMLLATCPDGRWRDGPKAVEDAKRACELTGWRDAAVVDTLAAAYAEAGDFPQAIRWQEEAIRLDDSQPELLHGARQRLALYRAGKPFRQAPAAVGSH